MITKCMYRYGMVWYCMICIIGERACIALALCNGHQDREHWLALPVLYKMNEGNLPINLGQLPELSHLTSVYENLDAEISRSLSYARFDLT